jgi:hypothetical protein
VAYQGDDFHEAPKGEEYSEEHFCDGREVGCDVLDICEDLMIVGALAGKSQCD